MRIIINDIINFLLIRFLPGAGQDGNQVSYWSGQWAVTPGFYCLGGLVMVMVIIDDGHDARDDDDDGHDNEP